MTNPYSEVYLDDAMSNLGEAFEYAIFNCNLTGQEFSGCFVKSRIAEFFGEGDAKYISGMSGIELARTVLERCEIRVPETAPDIIGYTPEYWVGWVYAYYQWYSGLSFEETFKAIPYERLYQMYWPVHEADISKAASIMDEIRKQCG